MAATTWARYQVRKSAQAGTTKRRWRPRSSWKAAPARTSRQTSAVLGLASMGAGTVFGDPPPGRENGSRSGGRAPPARRHAVPGIVEPGRPTAAPVVLLHRALLVRGRDDRVPRMRRRGRPVLRLGGLTSDQVMDRPGRSTLSTGPRAVVPAPGKAERGPGRDPGPRPSPGRAGGPRVPPCRSESTSVRASRTPSARYRLSRASWMHDRRPHRPGRCGLPSGTPGRAPDLRRRCASGPASPRSW